MLAAALSRPLFELELTDGSLCVLCELFQVLADILHVVVHHVAHQTQHLHKQHSTQWPSRSANSTQDD